MMHGRGKSGSAIVLVKPANKSSDQYFDTGHMEVGDLPGPHEEKVIHSKGRQGCLRRLTISGNTSHH
jgi:hypothetical protein